MDSKELREMSIINAKMALEQAKRNNEENLREIYWDMVKMGIDPTKTRRDIPFAETKKDSSKRLTIEDPTKLNNIHIEYEGRNLLDSMDNYSWKVVVDNKVWRVILYRDWIDGESVEGEVHHRSRIDNLSESLSREVWVDRRIVKSRESFIDWVYKNTLYYDKVR
jgi:hypothetical protein